MRTMTTAARNPEPTPGPARATYQDVLDAPAHRVAEIVEGVLHTHPRPAMPHALASSVLGRRIGNPYHDKIGGPGGWWIIDEPELHLGEDILVPDLAGWRRERMPDYPETAYVALAPDWVCEVLSVSTPPARPPWQAPDLCPRRRSAPVAHRSGGSRPGGVRVSRRPVGADRKRQGRRACLHPALRRHHVQPRRSLALSRPEDRRGGALPAPRRPHRAGSLPRTCGRFTQPHSLRDVVAFPRLALLRWRAPDGARLARSLAKYRPGDVVETSTILTTGANAAMRALHDRMPVILAREAFGAWLSGGEAALGPVPDDLLAMHAVILRVNSARHDDPECVRPATPA